MSAISQSRQAISTALLRDTALYRDTSCWGSPTAVVKEVSLLALLELQGEILTGKMTITAYSTRNKGGCWLAGRARLSDVPIYFPGYGSPYLHYRCAKILLHILLVRVSDIQVGPDPTRPQSYNLNSAGRGSRSTRSIPPLRREFRRRFS